MAANAAYLAAGFVVGGVAYQSYYLEDRSIITSCAKHFLSGTAAGISEVIVGQPLDTVKSRIQVELMSNKARASRGEMAILWDSLQKDGIYQLYRGSTSRIISGGVGGALLFGTFSSFKEIFGVKPEVDGIFTFGFMISASGTGIVESVVYTPFELLKVRAQVADTKSSSFFGTYNEVLRSKNGISSLFRGMSATMAREALGNLALFSSYQLCKNSLSRRFGKPSSKASYDIILLSGGVSGLCFWTVAHPFDTLKSIIQADSVLKPKYHGLWDCFLKVMKERGIWSLYIGLRLSLIRAFPVNACAFASYEAVLAFLDKKM